MQTLSTTQNKNVSSAKLKVKMRMIFKILTFLSVVGFCLIYSVASKYMSASIFFVEVDRAIRTIDTQSERTLESSCSPKADPPYMILAYIIGVLYLFFSLAIVADELFVPALDTISEKLGLSEDVAGATLMAAGGSSPELFANLVSTFLRSDVGFGAIVGSAVFNVLFVVGICAVVTGGTLVLSPWPLLRDSSYYMIVLIFLTIFFGVNSPGVIDWYEALFLQSMYWMYVFIMSHNASLGNWFDSYNFIKTKPNNTNTDGAILKSTKRSLSLDLSSSTVSKYTFGTRLSEAAMFSNPTRFRTGILKQLTHQHERGLLDSTGIALVTFEGQKSFEIFRGLDSNNDGYINADELRQLFVDLGHDTPEDEFTKALNEIDEDGDGRVNFNEFEVWYVSSKHRLDKFLESLFFKFDTNVDGILTVQELVPMFKQLCEGRAVTLEEVESYYSSMEREHDGGVSVSSFKEWFQSSDLQKERQVQNSVELQAVEGLSLLPPEKADLTSLFWYLLAWPLVCVLYFTVPDVRRPSQKNYCYVAFLMCLCWMGFLSYFMVSWIEVIGSTFGIPSILMGLTFLALGTSVPDMFSAIIVAKQGKGSQAVSSSVGSNVFDITVGLAVPWLLFWAVYQEPVVVTADSLVTSILGVVGAVVALVGVVMFSGWVLTSKSGWFLLFLYVAYVGWQAGTAQYGQC